MKAEKKKVDLRKSPLDIQRIRKDFPVLAQKIYGKPLVYLDNAATTQKPNQVIDAITRFYSEANSNVHRSVHSLGAEATEAYEGARKKIQEFIGAETEREVIFTRGTTESMNLIMRGWGDDHIQKGDDIIVTRLEHHSNFVPWQSLAERKEANFKIVELTDDYRIDKESFEKALSGKPKIVAISLLSNVLGGITPVHELAQLAKDKGAIVVIDAAQAIAHIGLKVTEMGPVDFVAFSGHKMCGPTGIGVLWGREELLEDMSPYQFGGDMIQEVRDTHTTWNELPYKYEAGTPNISGVIGLGAAVDYLESIGMENIASYEQEITKQGLQKFNSLKGVHLLGPKDSLNRAPVFAFTVDNIHPHDLATFLDTEGIAVRAGHHCTMPLHFKAGITASSRASFYFYNKLSEIDRLIEAIEKAKEYFNR